MNFRLHLAAIPFVATLGLAQSATYATFGTGCNATPHLVPYALNDTAPNLRVASLPNEYAYPVVNTAATPVQVTGFAIFTRTNSGTTTEVGFARVLADSSGAGATVHTSPDANSLAVGTIEVGPTPGWYSVAVDPPVVVQAGEAFWIGVDAYSRIAPPQNQGGSPSIRTLYYRRPPAMVWTSSVSVTNPILRVFAYAPAPAVPTLTASSAPVLGQQITLNVQHAPPGMPAFLMFAFTNTTWHGLTLPLDLALLGAPDCFSYTSADQSHLVITDGSGAGTLALSIPAAPQLTGFVFYNQAAVAGAANAFGFTVTNAGKGLLGP